MTNLILAGVPPACFHQSSGMNVIQYLRVVSLSEGVSFLLLLGVVMPLKYIWDMPIAVTCIGSAHGVLFVALGFLLLLAMVRVALPFKAAMMRRHGVVAPCRSVLCRPPSQATLGFHQT